MRNHLISFSLSFISESISEAPDPVRLALGVESAKWFGRSLISGGVVAFGCLLEIWETAVSVRNWFRARSGLAVKENPKSWGIPIAALGLLLCPRANKIIPENAVTRTHRTVSPRAVSVFMGEPSWALVVLAYVLSLFQQGLSQYIQMQSHHCKNRLERVRV